ncbi:hypothetical protein CBM2586_A11662 [Cupriavidus phytorum]|uniref:Uncharacterized protein n=1 Tax=Cupriavidus taiwanensis TaxID=164546 RepID=A0A975WSW7_9BURK|nr:hypothetical protein CBM2586_A11662 [Cupriavidus taiwanensis]
MVPGARGRCPRRNAIDPRACAAFSFFFRNRRLQDRLRCFMLANPTSICFRWGLRDRIELQSWGLRQTNLSNYG